jgi:hypothetical protein
VISGRPRGRRQAAGSLGRCLLAVAGAAVLAAATPVGPATAATDPCSSRATGLDVIITVWQPGPDTSPADAHQCTPAAGSTLSGSWNVRFDALSLASLKSFSVSVFPADTSIPPLPASATTSRTYPTVLLGNGKVSDSIQMPWDTGSLTPYNGTYQISATAVSLLGTTGNALVDHLVVNNPPARPAAPASTVDGTVPALFWTANSEPDLTSYQILRSVGGGAYAPVGTSQAANFRDTSAPQNKSLTYEVVAFRKSALDPAGIASAASPAGSPIVVAPPLPPPVAPAPVKPATKSTTRSAPAVDTGSSTFAPTLPFAQAVPTATATLPDVAPSGTAAALPAGTGYAKTTLAQKLPYLGGAVAIALIAFFLVRYALRLRRGEA